MHQKSRFETDHREVSLLSNPSWVSPQNHQPWRCSAARARSQSFGVQSSFSEIKEASTKIRRLCELLPNLHTITLRKNHWCVWICKTWCQKHTSKELVDNVKEINASLAEASGLALRQPVAEKQYVLMTDASFRASGFALVIEENVERKLLSKPKTFSPVVIESRDIFTSPIDDVNMLYRVFGNIPRFLWVEPCTMGNDKTSTFTNRQQATRFFQQRPHHPLCGMPVTTSYSLNSA